jgi:hypothetical protein
MSNPIILGEFLDAVETEPSPNTRNFAVRSRRSHETLGTVGRSGGWRCYVLSAWDDTIWSGGCLTDLAKFLNDLTDQQRSTWKG